MMGMWGERSRRRAAWSAGLLATTMLAGVHGVAIAAEAAAAPSGEIGEVIVTAQKREQNIQKVPMSIQAMDTKTLTQLNVTEFQDFVKYMPSVSFQTNGPNQTSIYMRGVSSGDNANHSGPLPTVGVYLDEMPITTIGGTIDVHVYDIARVEVLPGPQGTLYGASSEAGTMRIITNKPSTAGFSAAYDLQVNNVSHGGTGYTAEGYVNIPINEKAAIRLVGWDQHDAGYIDNVYGTRTFKTSQATINNSSRVKKDFNYADTIGGRAALKVDLNKNWTIEPTLIFQDQRNKGVFGYEPSVGYLQVQRFQPDTDHDRWGMASLAINGKVGRFDVTYAGGYFLRQVDQKSDYTDYSIFYDQHYGSGNYWRDNSGNTLANPSQEITGKDKFTKESHELRIASPSTDRLRFIGGLFEQRQSHWIIQDYQIKNFATDLSVPGWPGTIWLTDQMRIDRDAAVFGELSFDVTPRLTITAGIREYYYRNTLKGFYGFGRGYNDLTGYNSGMGSVSPLKPNGNCLSNSHYRGDPCVNLDKSVIGSGETHKVNATYKFDGDHLVYFTYSTGYRPGGVNRNSDFGSYSADTLDNYELGWKTSWFDRTLRFNGAVYYENWKKFQYSFLGPNSLTIIENGPDANILGVESSLDWRATDRLTLTANGAYNDAKLAGVLCAENIPVCPADEVQAPKGTQLPYTPKFKGNITARYTFSFHDWDGHVQGSVVYQTKNYVGLRTNDTASLGSLPAYATVDFSVGLDKGGVSTELFIKNLFDEHGQLNRSTPCTISVCTAVYTGIPQAVYVVPSQPLTVGLKFGQKF